MLEIKGKQHKYLRILERNVFGRNITKKKIWKLWNSELTSHHLPFVKYSDHSAELIVT